jgi:hypothetical protein
MRDPTHGSVHVQAFKLSRLTGWMKEVVSATAKSNEIGTLFKRFRHRAELEYGLVVHAGLLPTKIINCSKSKIQVM